MVPFASSIMKNNVVSKFWYGFAVKLICYITFGLASSAYYILKSNAIILY